MSSGSWFQRAMVSVLVLAAWGADAQRAHATIFDYSEDFSKFGRQPNNLACRPMAACGAVASINSFIFLEKRYPDIYDNKLTPNAVTDPVTKAVTDPTDASNFGVDGWKVDDNPMRRGYYDPLRPHNADFTDSFLNTKKDWFGDYAPNTTKFDSWFSGSTDHNRTPTISDLAGEIKAQEDVELFVRDSANYYHVISLVAIKCPDDAMKNCSIGYQDNDGDINTQVLANITQTDGTVTFTGLLSGQNRTVTITAAFSESPVPEPATCILLATGLAGLLGYGWRHRKRAA